MKMTTFKKAVQSTRDLENSYGQGLSSLEPVDRRRISVANTRHLRGSVNVDNHLKNRFPADNRWDYAIGYGKSSAHLEVYWVEVHPGNSREIDVVLAKLDWLIKWLKSTQSPLRKLPRTYVWISSGKTKLSPSAPQKKLALKGLRQVGRVLEIH